ncbi:MAG: acetyl-CoA carboxylase biotin carboxylase subunit, partial [Paeniglutamicibacter sp.]
DALMGKQIVWAADRDSAIKRMEGVLETFLIDGLKTSLPLLQRIMAHPDYRSNAVTTHWLNHELAQEVR